jgi:hypothetical protein
MKTIVTCLSVLLITAAIPALAQARHEAQPMATGDNVTSADPSVRRQMSAAEREREARRIRERQEELQRDTGKLQELSNQLKEVVEKSNEQQLSMDAVRKAEEIEKLARSVKKRLKDGL